MKHLRLQLVFCCLIIYLFLPDIKVQGQTKLGIGLDAYATSLAFIEKNQADPFTPSYEQDISFLFSPAFLVRQHFSEHFSLDVGLGYRKQKYQLELVDENVILSVETDRILRMSQHYLKIPLIFNYHLSLAQKADLVFSTGFNTNILLGADDNLQETTPVEVLYGKPITRLNSVLLSSIVSVAYQTVLAKNHMIELGLFSGLAISPFAEKNRLFNHFHSARNVYYGVHLKYFFKHF